MRLSIKAMAVAFGIFWGACVLFVGIANNIWPSYGPALLQLCASIYPGIILALAWVRLLSGPSTRWLTA